ncbi:hypothetical protein [Halobaculum roseum]|uniref:Uncharacterized protein n=1 Tax=Halobaculum roseum TaxID=2175149 RepID=A0ABD5MML8_9EURY|nr:hypothetical protein [Halobaculum roseum]QZY03578.1 hypothetical protein K6T36_05275 [Halobaculum roseum]
MIEISSPYNLPEIAQVLGAVGSIILSALLVLLYDKQASIQNTQRKLMENQNELQQLQHKPLLEIDHIGTGEHDDFCIILSNVGKGAARNVEIELEPVLDWKSAPEEDIYTRPTRWVPRKEGAGSGPAVRSPNCYIKPETSEEVFSLTSALYIRSRREYQGDHDDVPAAFVHATGQLAEAGKEWLRLKMTIHYEDIDEEPYSQEFADLALPIKGRTLLEASMEYGTQIEAVDSQRMDGPHRDRLEENTDERHREFL